MRLLVFGGWGQFGTEIARAAEGSHELIRPTRAEADVTDAVAVTAAVDDAGPDVVVNAAAFHKVEACEADPANQQFGIEDGSAGLQGELIESDHWANAKAFIALLMTAAMQTGTAAATSTAIKLTKAGTCASTTANGRFSGLGCIGTDPFLIKVPDPVACYPTDADAGRRGRLTLAVTERSRRSRWTVNCGGGPSIR